jgi:hypothetical protein
MNVRVLGQPLFDGIIDDIQDLIAEIAVIGHAMGMVALLPNFACKFFADCERKPALDELCASFDRLLRTGRQEDVDVVRHDDEGVQVKFARVAVAEERCDKEFGDCVALKDAATLMGDGR